MKNMSFMQHLDELRWRLVICVVVWCGAFTLCWWQSQLLWQVLMAPLAKVLPVGHRMIFTGPSEAFMAYVKVAALASFTLSWPVWAWHIWRFVSPGLMATEKPMTLGILVGSTCCFLCGVAFAYVYVCPAAYQFFASFEMPSAIIPLQLEMRVSEYVSFTARIMTAFGLCGQLPLVMVLCTRCGWVTYFQWKRLARPVCAVIFVISALMTPPDVLSMLALAVPMCLLYVGTLVFLAWANTWKSTQNPPRMTTTEGPTGQS